MRQKPHAASVISEARWRLKSIPIRALHRRSLFKNIEIETISACNLKCPRCPVAEFKRPVTLMSVGTWRRLIDQLSEISYAGSLSPHFFNEPLMDKRLPGLLSYARERLPRASLFLFTNMTLMTVEKYKELAASVDQFVVVIDEPEIAEATQGLLSRLTEKEARKIQVRHLSREEEHNRGGLVAAGLDVDNEKEPCRIPSEYMIINAEGQALFCFNDYFGKHAFGNVRDVPILEIWNAKEYCRQRVNMLCGRRTYDMCRSCNNIFGNEYSLRELVREALRRRFGRG